MGSGRHVAAGAGRVSRMSLWRGVLSECVRLRRSPLIALHLACGLIAGVACGAYFGVAPWDPRLGTDAFVQLIGALMPLMVAIVCGLDIDGEREASGLSNLLALPSRRARLAARVRRAVAARHRLASGGALGSFAGVLGAFGLDGFSAGSMLAPPRAWRRARSCSTSRRSGSRSPSAETPPSGSARRASPAPSSPWAVLRTGSSPASSPRPRRVCSATCRLPGRSGWGRCSWSLGLPRIRVCAR